MLLDWIAPLKQLKSFKIWSHRGVDKNLISYFDPKKHFAFPNIPLISIDAQISPHFNFKHFLKNIQASQTKKEINLSKIFLYSVNAFKRLLAEFKSAARCTTQLSQNHSGSSSSY